MTKQITFTVNGNCGRACQHTSKYTTHYNLGLEQLFKEISLGILGKYIKLICKEIDLDKIMETTIDTVDKG